MATALIVGAIIAGGVITAKGQRDAGQAAKDQADAESAWHQYNAEVARREAEEERIATDFAVRQQGRKAEALQKKQRALIGASGVNIAGSPLLLAEDTAEQLKLEEIDIKTKGLRRAASFESQAILDESKSKVSRRRGKSLLKAAKKQALGTLISTAGTAAGVSGVGGTPGPTGNQAGPALPSGTFA
jgi:hypothetical protein